MRAYKFLDKADVDKMLGGTVLMRPLRHFIKLEATAGRWIGDAMESGVLANIKGLHTAQSVSEMTPVGFSPIIGGHSVESYMEDCIIHFKAPDDFYIWSSSVGNLKDLKSVMCIKSERNPKPYEACIEILDLEAFTRHVHATGVIGPTTFSGAFSECQLAQVSYQEVTKVPGTGRLPSPGPFIKSKDFEFQREHRFAAKPRGNLTDQIIVHFPRPAQFLRQITI